MDKKAFSARDVFSVAWGHFTHDTYSAFVAPLLPVLREKLALSFTQLGLLGAVTQLPSLLNPFIGLLAEHLNVRMFVVIAPALTATFASLLGLVPSYAWALVLLLSMGFSVAAFHATAPATVAELAGEKTGLGMGWFMAAGEAGRTLGPLLVVSMVSWLTLEGMWPVMFLGWGSSALLFWRLRGVNVQPVHQSGWNDVLARTVRVFVPLTWIVTFRLFLAVEATTYLPTFLQVRGASLLLAGGALTVLELAGVFGALTSGTLSDHWGRKPVLALSIGGAALWMFLFLRADGWLMLPLLVLIGFFLLATQPVFLALVQDYFPQHRSAANGLYTALVFSLRSGVTVLIGMMGDKLGLEQTYLIGIFLGVAAIPAIWLLPDVNAES